MQMMLPAIRFQLITVIVNAELPVADAIGVAARNTSEMSRTSLIFVQRIVAEYHVVKMAVSIGYVQAGDNPAVSNNSNLHPTTVG